jgi:hypothetical protein
MNGMNKGDIMWKCPSCGRLIDSTVWSNVNMRWSCICGDAHAYEFNRFIIDIDDRIVPDESDGDISARVRVWCEQTIPNHIQTIRTTRDNGVIKRISKLCMKQYTTLRRKNTVPNSQMRLFFVMNDLRNAIYIRSTNGEVNNNGFRRCNVGI